MTQILDLCTADTARAAELLDAELGGRRQARRGELVDALEGEGLIASIDGQTVGLLTWLVDPTGVRAEIRAVAVKGSHRRMGIGRALLEAAHTQLRARTVDSSWLVTTNDNLGAIALYEALGYRVVEVRRGAIDAIRRTLKPSIPMIGEHGIPVRDELEFELALK